MIKRIVNSNKFTNGGKTITSKYVNRPKITYKLGGNQNMSREEAKIALDNGLKVTHIYFSEHEYVYKQGTMMIMEDGASISESIFWGDRHSPSFDTGWSVFQKQK